MARAVLVAGLGGLLLAGCVSKPVPAPPPAPAPIAPPALAPAPAPAVVADWPDLPLTPGEWRYAEEGGAVAARFAAANGAGFVIRCERSTGRLLLAREGEMLSGGMTIRTSSTLRSFAAATASLAAGDPFLDALAFSRGRFAVEAEGSMMILPAWPELARVTEDCRS